MCLWGNIAEFSFHHVIASQFANWRGNPFPLFWDYGFPRSLCSLGMT